MRNVIVTGGSRGLGLAIGLALAVAGYRVIAVARKRSTELDASAEAASLEQRGALAFRAYDLMDLAGLGPFVAATRKEFGPIYGLVNNAGIGTAGLLSMTHNDAIVRTVQLNTVSPIILTKYVLRSMMNERAGRIVNVASVVASSGWSGLAAYAASKAALVGFTRSLAREVGPLGITVNAVAPGFIETQLTRDVDDERREKLVRRSALRHLAHPEDVAAAVAFLLSDGGRNVTGTTVTVDAGATA
jgi:3-oxoacyl-[acyl-carrier protein] reductase